MSLRICLCLVLLATLSVGSIATASQWSAKPTYKSIEFSALKVLRTPSLGEQHDILDDVPGLQDAGLSIPVRCTIFQAEGVIGWMNCEPLSPSKPPPEIAEAASRFGERYSISLQGIDYPQGGYLRTTTTLKLIPPRLRLEKGETEVTPSREFTFARTPTARDMSRNWPDRAQRMEYGGSVRVLCQVLPDFSLGCPEADPVSENGSEFVRAGRTLASMMVVEPNLKNGEPAVGKWLIIPLNFRMPD